LAFSAAGRAGDCAYESESDVKLRYKILIGISAVAILVDQITKMWAKTLMTRPPIVVVENFFRFVYVENKGSAWGMFSDLPDAVRIPFFMLISVVAIVFIIYMFRRLDDRHRFAVISLSLIFGGAMGNFIDRVAYKSVIDFIDWHWYDAHWPTFNMADVFITMGVLLLLREMLFGSSDLSLLHPQNADSKRDAGRSPAGDD